MMRTTIAAQRLLAALATTCAVSTVACEDEAETATEVEASPDAAAAKTPAVEPELAEALAQAKEAPQRQAAEQGPPPNGVFAPGQADKEAKAGAPPKVVVGQAGSPPKLTLLAQPKAGQKKQGKLNLSIQNDRRQAPLQLTLDISWSTKAASGDDAKGVLSQVRIDGAAPAGGGRLPAEAAKEFAKLKGAKVTWTTLPDGGTLDFEHEVPKAAPDELGGIVRALLEVLQTLTIAVPDSSVGKGAMWMVTNRAGVFGLDMVTYKMVKVQDVSEQVASLSADIKRYAADADFESPMVQADADLELAELAAPGQVQLKLDQTSGMPQSAEVKMVLGARLSVVGMPQQGVEVHATTQATLELEP